MTTISLLANKAAAMPLLASFFIVHNSLLTMLRLGNIVSSTYMYIRTCIHYTYTIHSHSSLPQSCCTPVDLNNSIDALRVVNSTVVKLLNLTIRLQDELNNLTASLVTLDMQCRNASLGSLCDPIPTQSYDVVDYTLVRNIPYKCLCYPLC